MTTRLLVCAFLPGLLGVWGCGDNQDETTVTIDPSTIPSGPEAEGMGGLDDGLDVQVEEGRSVWPPSGPGCEALIACCEAVDPIPSAGLFCRLSVAADPDCNNGMASVRTYLTEQGAEVPAACTDEGSAAQTAEPTP